MATLKIADKNPYNFESSEAASKQFKVAAMGENECSLTSYNRRNFYKITLITKGNSNLLYADRELELNKPALIFTNPLVPYSWESSAGDDHEGYFCVFTDEFLQAGSRMENLQESALFKTDVDPVFLLNEEQVGYIGNLFRRMRSDIDTDYPYKYDLIRNQLSLMIHEAFRMQPAVNYPRPQNAASRIAKLFLTLMDKQFPVDSPQQVLKLKTAGDYAEKLAIHVNHLNAAVQEMTGKSTTVHIRERMIAEARSLLKHTDWSVAEIAFSLGFEYPSYFNNFFKKHNGVTPMVVRNDKNLMTG